MAALDCDVLGLDWTVNLGRARALVGGSENGPGKALQGNIDPNVLFAPPAHIATEVARVLDSFGTPYQGTGTGPTHIFNLGHGISQYTPPEHVAALVEAVHPFPPITGLNPYHFFDPFPMIAFTYAQKSVSETKGSYGGTKNVLLNR
jgi:uroporphyrinogen-III decarboxylase